MPIATHPDAPPVEVVLPTDAQITNRPIFHARFLTAREDLRRREIIRRIGEAEDDAAALDLLIQLLGLLCDGWRNLHNLAGEPINPARTEAGRVDAAPLADVLTSAELWDLAGAIVRATNVVEADLKKSESPSESDSAGSAPTADPTRPAQADGGASTPPTTPPRP
jgi:hypothetical protein